MLMIRFGYEMGSWTYKGGGGGGGYVPAIRFIEFILLSYITFFNQNTILLPRLNWTPSKGSKFAFGFLVKDWKQLVPLSWGIKQLCEVWRTMKFWLSKVRSISFHNWGVGHWLHLCIIVLNIALVCVCACVTMLVNHVIWLPWWQWSNPKDMGQLITMS